MWTGNNLYNVLLSKLKNNHKKQNDTVLQQNIIKLTTYSKLQTGRIEIKFYSLNHHISTQKSKRK